MQAAVLIISNIDIYRKSCLKTRRFFFLRYETLSTETKLIFLLRALYYATYPSRNYVLQQSLTARSDLSDLKCLILPKRAKFFNIISRCICENFFKSLFFVYLIIYLQLKFEIYLH